MPFYSLNWSIGEFAKIRRNITNVFSLTKMWKEKQTYEGENVKNSWSTVQVRERERERESERERERERMRISILLQCC